MFFLWIPFHVNILFNHLTLLLILRPLIRASTTAVAYLKEFFKLGSIEKYAWIEGKEIIADVLTKTG